MSELTLGEGTRLSADNGLSAENGATNNHPAGNGPVTGNRTEHGIGRPASRGAEVTTMIGRCLRLSRRNVEALIMSLAMPVMLMLVFVYLFGGAINTGTPHYVTYVVPGVLLLCAGFGSSLTAVSVCQDMAGGIIDRFRSMDIGGTSAIIGHVVASTVRNLVSTALVFGIAFAIGFRPQANATGWLAAVGVLLLFVFALSWLSASIGLLFSSSEGANGFTFFIMFLPYASSAFVPIDTMPSWLRGFAEHQPITSVIETLRGLLLDTPTGDNPILAVSWSAGILAVAIVLAGVLFARRIR
ncbi:MAG TPA: ABC transporter permease [Pseudonocardiaceae bacterium]|jgi:ABC-2 type transport system permease protein|nr:ABC transporter permease [Pseudonocardiaceae bacterium]